MRRVLSLLLALACMVPLCACGGIWKKESKKPTAEQIAGSLADRAGEIGLDNALSELTVKSETMVDGDTFYRFQQNYQGLPVYGRSVAYAIDSDGKEIALCSNALDVSENISLSPTISETEATDAAYSVLSEEIGESGEASFSVQLCIYNLAGKDARLAYCINSEYYLDSIYYYEIIVDAENGDVLSAVSTLSAQTDTGYTASDTDKKDGFPVWREKDDDGKNWYYLADDALGISVRTFNGKKSLTSFFGRESSHFNGDGNDYSSPIVSDDNIFGNGEEASLHYENAVRLMKNVSEIQTIMEDKFDFRTRNRRVILYIDDGYDYGKNAVGGLNAQGGGVISVGSVTGVDDLDVVAHEYGHVISHTIIGWSDSPLDEAFSDVFGELMEARLSENAEPNWINTNDNRPSSRDLTNPAATGGYGNVSEIGTNADEDKYTCSTIVSHAFYLMWNGIDGNSKKMLNTDQLLNLWHRTLLLLTPDADYTTCRMMAEIAAKSIHLSDMQLSCVGEAFEEVGIRKYTGSADYTTGGTFNLTVLTKDGQPYDSYSYQISGVQAKDGQETVVQTYYQKESVDTDEPQRITLKPGAYTITIQNRIGEADPVTIRVNVEKNGQTDSVMIATNYSSRPLVETVFSEIREVETLEGNRTIDVAIPKINLKSDEIEQLNDYILQTYSDSCKLELERLKQNGYIDLRYIRYDWFAYGDLLTLYIDEKHEEYSSKEMYSISISEKRKLTTEETLAIIGISESEFREKVREAIGSICLDANMPLIDEVGIDWVEELYNTTISDDTVDRAIPFLNENGQLCILGTIYSGAGGSGYYSQIINLDTFTLSEWYGTDFAALKNEKESTKYSSVSEPYASFLREKKYLEEYTGSSMTAYCLYDINQDGTDELILSGTQIMGIGYMFYTYDKNSKQVAYVGYCEDFSGIEYSAQAKAIISCWRSMNNGNPIYMYTAKWMSGTNMDSRFFTYYSDKDQYVDDFGNSMSESEVEKYLSNTITFEFIPLEE